MRWIRWGAAAGALAIALAACGARTELVVGDADVATEALAEDAPDGGVAPDPEDAGASRARGPCFLCQSPLVQECGYCLVQGFDSTYVCPVTVVPPERGCLGLQEDHATSQGTHFTCWYCP